MPPIRKGDGTSLAPKGIAEVRKGDGTVIYSAGSDIPDSGVFRHTFDNADTTGSTALDVWNNFDGTINGATTGVSGANQTYSTAEAYDFDGVDDSVSIPNDPQLVFGDGTTDSPFSVAAWINPDASSQFRIIVKSGSSLGTREYLFTITGSDNLGLVFYDDGSDLADQCRRFGTTDFSTLTGTWSHVVATYDGSGTASGISLYVDGGAESYSETSTGGDYTAMGDEGGSLDIGYFETTGSYADGTIDDPRLYDKELTSTEVSNLYSSGSI